MVKRFGGFCDDMREAVMNREELQVLKALETGLAHAELACVVHEDDPLLLRLCEVDVQRIRAAIEIVERWDTRNE